MKQVLPPPEGLTIKILEGVLNRSASAISIPFGIPRFFSVGNVIFGTSRVFFGSTALTTVSRDGFYCLPEKIVYDDIDNIST